MWMGRRYGIGGGMKGGEVVNCVGQAGVTVIDGRWGDDIWLVNRYIFALSLSF